MRVSQRRVELNRSTVPDAMARVSRVRGGKAIVQDARWIVAHTESGGSKRALDGIGGPVATASARRSSRERSAVLVRLELLWTTTAFRSLG